MNYIAKRVIFLTLLYSPVYAYIIAQWAFGFFSEASIMVLGVIFFIYFFVIAVPELNTKKRDKKVETVLGTDQEREETTISIDTSSTNRASGIIGGIIVSIVFSVMMACAAGLVHYFFVQNHIL